jgi:hypothetical protein
VHVGDAYMSLIEPVTQNRGAKPAIRLELAQVIEQAAQGVMRRSPGAIDRGLGGRVGAGFGYGVAVEAPGGAHNFNSQQLLDGADGVQFLPKSFGELGVLRRSLWARHSFVWRRGRT